MTSTGKKSRTSSSKQSNIHPRHLTSWSGQSVFKLDNITSNSGFRTRPSTSCAECKRLKIKCLKNESAQVAQTESTSKSQAKTIFPCLTCIRRGCEAICSDRSSSRGANNTTSKGLGSNATIFQHRQPLVLHTQTQILEYQNHITALKRRVRELENALRDAHAKLSDDTHPLLTFDLDVDLADRGYTWNGTERLNKGHDESQDQVPNLRETQKQSEEDSVVEAFGSLSIKEDGRSTYHAQNAGAWYYLQFNDEGVGPDVGSDATPSSTNTNESQNGTPSSTADEVRGPISLSAILTPDIICASRIFPMGAIDDANISSEILMRIENYLPTREEALRLVDNYYANSSWLYDPISRSHFMSDIFDTVYPPGPISEPHSWSSTQSQFPSDDPASSLPKRHCSLLSYSLTLAMFFITLAIGTHLDLDQQCGSPCNNIYYHLARAAIASDGVGNTKSKSVDEPAIQTETSTGTGMSACLLEPGLDVIRVLLLMCYYLHMSDGRTGYSASWALMGLVTKLASGIGLHRDPSKWNLDSAESKLRQEVFWELYTYDSWQSFPSGRPPSFLRMGIDLKRPYEQLLKKYQHPENRHDKKDLGVDVDKLENDDVLDIFKAWKHHFCFMKLGPTVEQAWGARVPSYYTILVLDRVLREELENTPVLLRLPPESGILPASKTPEMSGTIKTSAQSPEDTQRTTPLNLDPRTMTSLTMQRYTLLFMTHVALILMHRPYFVQALNISDQPLMTKFAASVLAVYRSSCTLVIRGMELYALEPRLSPRLWYFWAQIFSSVTCLGGLVVHSPNLSLASSALAHIELACDLFERVKDSNRVTRALPTMLKLRDRARLILNAYQAQSAQRSQDQKDGRRTTLSDSNTPDQNKGTIPVPMLGEDEKDEFSGLVGQTRLVDLRTNSSGAKLYAHSNVQSLVSRHHFPPIQELHSATFPQAPTSHMAPPSVSVSAPLSAVGVPGSDPYPIPIHADRHISTSANPGHVPESAMTGVRIATTEFNTEFRDQLMTSSEHVDQFQSSFETQAAQLIDPFLLFRQLGLDLAPSNTSGGMDMEMCLYADAHAPRIEPHWPFNYDPTKSQVPGDTVSGDATESLQGQQFDFITGMDMNIVQPQDTDTAFEKFIAQALKGYTSRSDLNSSPFGTSELNLNINLGNNQVSTSNYNLHHDPLGPSSWNQTFDMMEPGSQNIQDQRFRNFGPGSTGGQSLSTYLGQPSFDTNIPRVFLL